MKIEELSHENIKLRVQFEETLKVNSKLEHENFELKETNSQLDREIYASKQSAKISESLARTSSRQEFEHVYE